MRVVALKKHRYGGKRYEIGESYEAQDRYAKALILARVVKVEAEPELPKAEQQRPKRRYRRRDLEAEA